MTQLNCMARCGWIWSGGAAAVVYRLNASDYLGEAVLGRPVEPDAAARLDEIGTTEFGLAKGSRDETALPSVTSNGITLTPLGIYCDYDEYPPELAVYRNEPYTLHSFGALCKVYYTDGTEGEVPYDLSRVEKVVGWDQLELFVP